MKSAIIASSRKRSNYVFDTDFEANVIDVAGTNTIPTPPKPQLILLDEFMRWLKDNGLFAVGDSFTYRGLNNPALYMFGRINWFKNGVIYTAGGGISQTIYGEEGNGIDGYIGTGFNPTVGTNHYTQNSASRIITLYKNWTTSAYVDGVSGSTNNRLHNFNGQSSRINSNSNLPSAFDFSGTGTLGIVRTSSSSVDCYNKTVSATIASTSAAMTNAEQRQLQSSSSFSDAGITMDFMGGAITSTQFQGLRTRANIVLDGFSLPQLA